MIAFDIRKTIEAAAYLIKRHACRSENYMRLIKLLYLADRLSLKERGVTICGGSVYAMKRGPVMSQPLDLIKGRDPQSTEWEQFIKKDEFDVCLVRDPGNMNLSRADIKILERVAEEFRTLDEWALVHWCHKNLPEYQKNWQSRGEKTRKRIPFEDVLEAVGRTKDRNAIVSAVNERSAFARFFNNHLPS
ncbi:MAG TPA: Panacea domain-containing protein [Pirellulales bacterium]|nr:Panacea domain-containing protein [Pirellulales bacterium]